MLEINVNDLKTDVKELDEKILLISLTGFIDTFNSTAFTKEVERIVKEGYVKIIFECKELSYLSSTGIGAMTQLLKNIRGAKGDIVLLNAQPRVYDVFSLLGFSTFFKFKNSMEEALAVFNVGYIEEKAVFPKVVECPVCNKRLRASKPGRFKCPECDQIITINDDAKVKV